MKRNDSIIYRKFIQMMIPAFGTAIAISLNEFVDSIIVSQLIGSEAMAIVSLGTPIMFLTACVYSLVGIGGSVQYARAIGQKRGKQADYFWSLSVMLAFMIGAVAMIIGLLFRTPIAGLLAGGSDMYEAFRSYSLYLYVSFPLVTLVMTAAAFLPSMNRPLLGASCSLIANIVNLLMDVVYIRFFNLGVNGAALATLTGYALTGVMLVVLYMKKILPSPFGMFKQKFEAACVGEIVKTGMTEAAVDLGYSLTTGFCNSLAFSYGGDDGLIAFAFFNQLTSMISIFMAGVGQGSIPVYSFLFGIDDKKGINMLTRRAAALLEALVLALVLVFLLFPGMLYSLFSIDTPERMELCLNSIYAFAMFAPFRVLIVQYRKLLNAVGHSRYSLFLSTFDCIFGIFAFAIIGTQLFGINGLWYGYPLKIATMYLIIIAYNAARCIKSGRTLSPVSLLPKAEITALIDSTVGTSEETMTELSREAVRICRENDFSENVSTFTGLLIEEMSVYTWNHCDKKQYIDIMARREGEMVKLDFRSIGKPFNPLVENEMDEHYNVAMIRGLVKDIKYEYALGLNTTTILIG